jgi:hypothetical protein
MGEVGKRAKAATFGINQYQLHLGLAVVHGK